MTDGRAPSDSPYRPPGAAGSARPRPYNKLAVVGFILAWIPCLNIIGGILSVIALMRITPREFKGQGLAVGGIVVAALCLVVSVLAAIAVPNYIRFTHRAKQAEAKTNLKAIYTAAMGKRIDTGELGTDFGAIDWTPPSGTRYTYYYGDDRIEPDRAQVEALPRDVDVWVRPERGEFKAVAVSNLDSDATLDVWAITHDNDLELLVDDIVE